MILRGLFSQIVMVALAIGIALLYIQPTFDDISTMQEEIALYQTEKQKVDRVNDELGRLVSGLNSVPESDQRKLLRYVPDEVDNIAVPRVLQIITQESGVLLDSIIYDGVDFRMVNDAELAGTEDYPIPHLFGVRVQGTYRQIKTMLELLERNEYPLEVHGLDVSVFKEPLLNANFQIITYSHVEPPPSEFSGS